MEILIGTLIALLFLASFAPRQLNLVINIIQNILGLSGDVAVVVYRRIRTYWIIYLGVNTVLSLMVYSQIKNGHNLTAAIILAVMAFIPLMIAVIAKKIEEGKGSEGDRYKVKTLASFITTPMAVFSFVIYFFTIGLVIPQSFISSQLFIVGYILLLLLGLAYGLVTNRKSLIIFHASMLTVIISLLYTGISFAWIEIKDTTVGQYLQAQVESVKTDLQVKREKKSLEAHQKLLITLWASDSVAYFLNSTATSPAGYLKTGTKVLIDPSSRVDRFPLALVQFWVKENGIVKMSGWIDYLSLTSQKPESAGRWETVFEGWVDGLVYTAPLPGGYLETVFEVKEDSLYVYRVGGGSMIFGPGENHYIRFFTPDYRTPFKLVSPEGRKSWVKMKISFQNK